MSTIEKITVDRQAARLPKDMEKHCQKALEMGATQAKIIPVQEIVVDDRVLLKVIVQ
jgi:predicted metal-binding protein